VKHTTIRRYPAVFQPCCLGILSSLIGIGVSACSDAQYGNPGVAPLDTPSAALSSQSGVQEGEFVAYVADFDDGHSERWYALRQNDGRELPLSFDRPPALVTGTRVRLQGDMAAAPVRTLRDTTSASMRVSSIELVSATDRVESANPVTWPLAASETYALVLVDLGSGVNVTAAQGQTSMFSTNPADKSFASFYYESSNGKYSISGDVIGPYTYSMTTCNTTGMYQAIEPQITKSYNHLIYYFTKSSLCTFGGLGEEGSVAMPAKRTWMNGSLGCVVLMQEPGHNLGLMHANTMACSGASFSATPTSCTITEYGSPWSPMGSGCHQLNGYEKWYEQWISGCNGVRVNSTGTFNLAPLGMSCPGAVQVLQVPMPATRTVSDPQSTNTTVNLKNYYVELRAPAGTFDQYSTGGRGGGFTQPTVTVYASDDVRAAANAGRGMGNSVWTELLNMNPSASTSTFAGLQVGVPFSDPSGSPTITLQSISAAGAVVNVTVQNGTGGATCIDGTMLTGSGTSCDGGAVVIPPADAGIIEASTPEAAADSNTGAPDARSPTPDAQTSNPGTVGTGSSSGGATSAPDATSAARMPGATAGGAVSDADVNAAWAQAAAQTPACACQSVGAPMGGARDASLAGGALALLGLLSRHPRRKRAGRPGSSNAP
jgi:hypothetical protein